MRLAAVTGRARQSLSEFVAGRHLVDWICLILFIAAGTPVEIADDRSMAGLALLFRAVAAMAVTGVVTIRFGLPNRPPILAGIFVIATCHVLINLISPAPTAFMAAATLTCGLVLAASAVQSARARSFLAFLLRGYLIFHTAGFLVSAVLWFGAGEAIDLHRLLFPFSSARQTQMLGVMRLTGFHIEPGTYAQAVFVVVLARAIMRGHLLNVLDLVGLATAVATVAAWAALGVSLYFTAVALEVVVLNRQVAPLVKTTLTIASTLLFLSVGPALLSPTLMQSDYADFMLARLVEGRGSTESKVLQYEAWLSAIDWRIIFGHPMSVTFCEYCEGVQDLGLAFNMVYYLGVSISVPVLALFGLRVARSGGLIILIAAFPLLTVKFFFHDFLVWVVIGIGLWASARNAASLDRRLLARSAVRHGSRHLPAVSRRY